MSSDLRTRGLSETCNQRGPNRPLFTKGGPPNYVEKSLAAAAEPFKGITSDGSVIAESRSAGRKTGGFDAVDSRGLPKRFSNR